MPALAVVPDLNELEHGAAHLGLRRKHAGADQFLRQHGEEALDDRVVPAVPHPAHARREVGRGEPLLVRLTRVLRPAVGVMAPTAHPPVQ